MNMTTNIKKPRTFKASNSYSTTDIYYKLIKLKKLDKLKYPISVYRDIINTLNSSIVNELLKKGNVLLPINMGELYIDTYEQKVTYNAYQHKYKPNSKINWCETKKLWLSDNETKANKTLIYYNNKKHFIVRYVRKNKSMNLIRFRLHHSILKTIGELVNQDKIKGIHSKYKSSI